MSCVPEVVHIGDLLHTQPTELTGTHSAVHTVTAAIIGLHDVGTTARARFDLLCIFSNKTMHYRRPYVLQYLWSACDRDVKTFKILLSGTNSLE